MPALKDNILTRLSLLLLAAACVQPPRLVVSDADRVLRGVTIDAPNPAEPGRYAVARFHYGSGTDRRRMAYRDSVTVRTRSVNATPFLRGIDAKALKERLIAQVPREAVGVWLSHNTGFDMSTLPPKFSLRELNERIVAANGPSHAGEDALIEQHLLDGRVT